MAETRKAGEGGRDPSRTGGELGGIGELGEIFGAAGRVNTVFGAPIAQGELTVVPVARARWGLGGGRGLRPAGDGQAQPGMGSGGGLRVDPVGIVVMRGDDAEFRPIPAETRWGLLLGVAALGFLIGRL